MLKRLWVSLALIVLVLAGGTPVGGETPDPVHSSFDHVVWPEGSGASDLTAPEQWALWRAVTWRPLVVDQPEWQVSESRHFRFHVLSGTAAARDLPAIAGEAEASLARMSARLGLAFDGTMDVYLVERVFWQGGATYDGFRVLVTYNDRNYVDIPLSAYLDHELVHALAQNLHVQDGHWNSLMAEGLAVWAVGGHYGPEPIDQMAAALIPMGRYVPIQKLLDNFHDQQHEIAYIEAGSFVSFLVERYGLATVKRFYSHADRPEEYFQGKSYADLERDWLAWLEQQRVRERTVGAAPFDERWWQLQIRYFDVMRAYQGRFDPLARTLPHSPAEWDGFARADYASNPDGATNLALESQLQGASQGLYCGDLAGAARRLDEVESSATAGAVRGVEAGERLALAELLATQDRALRRLDAWAYLRTADPTLHARLGATLRTVPSAVGMRQELARLWLSPDRRSATAWVSWLPLAANRAGLPAATHAYRFTFRRGDDGRWLLTDFHPLPPTTLISRNQRLCNPLFAASS